LEYRQRIEVAARGSEMNTKITEPGSKIAEKLDTNSDGILSDQELHDLKMQERLMRLNDEDAKRDQQRYMVWFSAISVTVYIAILMTPIVPLERVDMLQSVGTTWLISNMGIIGAFIGFNAIKKNGNGK